MAKKSPPARKKSILIIGGSDSSGPDEEDYEEDYEEDVDTTPTAPGEVKLPPKTVATKTTTVYGIAKDLAKSTAAVQVWKTTTDPYDIGRPADEFIPCQSVADGQAELVKRFPPPALPNGVKETTVLSVARVGSLICRYDTQPLIVVTDRPTLTQVMGSGYTQKTSIGTLMATAEAYGGVYIGVPNVTSILHNYGRHDANAIHRVSEAVEEFVADTSEFKLSNLTFRQVECGPDLPKIRLLVPEPNGTVDRKKREQKRLYDQRRARALEHKRTVAREREQEQINARVREVGEVYNLIDMARKSLEDEVPQVFELYGLVDHGYTTLARLHATVRIHQKYRGPAAWRRVHVVQKALIAGHSVAKCFLTKFDPERSRYLHSSRAKYLVNRRARCHEALTWFVVEANRAAAIAGKRKKTETERTAEAGKKPTSAT